MAVYLSVDIRDDGAVQLSIWDDDGGYRIAGPKYDGKGRTVLKRSITLRDRDEILSYLRRVK